MTEGFDFNERPFLVIWETTHACDLACVHCRAQAEPSPSPDELTTGEGEKLIRDVKDMRTPILIFSGGDPLKRRDLFELIAYAKSLRIRVGAIPAVTPLLTPEILHQFRRTGLDQIAFSLDAAEAAQHDAFRRVDGVFKKTLECVRLANEIGLPVQINSLINVHNTENLDALLSLVESLKIVFWEVFFLVPMGRGKELPLLVSSKFDEAFKKIYALSKRARFVIKVTEAPHYRMFVHRQKLAGHGSMTPAEEKTVMPEELRKRTGPDGTIGHAPQGVNSGKGFLFVSYRGEVMPSGFLPINAGNVREKSLSEIYRHSNLFRELRDLSLLKGKCGICEYNDFCGGSRARAYALTGDYLAEDSCCSYQPAVP